MFCFERKKYRNYCISYCKKIKFKCGLDLKIIKKYYINMKYYGICFIIVCRWEWVVVDEFGFSIGIYFVCVLVGVGGRLYCGGRVFN